MARRRHSRRSVRRNSRRRVRRNRGLVRNIFGASLTRDVLVPVAGGTAGFLAARFLGHVLAEKVPQLNGNVKLGKAIAAGVGIPLTFAYAGLVRQTGLGPGSVVLGMGLGAAEAYLRDTPLLGGSRAAAAITEPAPPAPEGGTGSYYNSGMLGQTLYAAAGLGRGYDLSHAGAPYTGMMGFGDDEDPSDQATVDQKHDLMEAVSTITPTDTALPAPSRPQIRPIDHPFAEAGQGYAGGAFARHLFSGMYGA